jgi:hypothetical protein
LDALIAQIQKIVSRLPGPGKLIFGALIADRQAFNVLVACIAAVTATSLQPPVLSLWTPALQEGLRDPGSSVPLLVAAGQPGFALGTIIPPQAG